MNVDYWHINEVHVDEPGRFGWKARSDVAISNNEVRTYRGSGNWDVYDLVDWDPDTGVVTIGRYLRTDWRS